MPRTNGIVREAAAPVPLPSFSCFETPDALGRTVTFYISNIEVRSAIPIAVFVQGSGCHSAFRVGKDGRVYGGYQNVLLGAARGRARVIVVEKPGVRCLDSPRSGGTAHDCPRMFLREHTLPRWAAAIDACLRALCTLSTVDTAKILLVGHSEGGQVAAKVAAMNSKVSHVALLSSTGPTQLFDLMVNARASGKNTRSFAAADERVKEVFETFKAIESNPDSITKFAWGHPFRRWSSFLASSTLDELLRSQARIYVAHGARDQTVPLASFDILCTELVRRRREVVIRCVDGAGHDFSTLRQKSPKLISCIFSDVFDWFLKGGPSRKRKATDQLQP